MDGDEECSRTVIEWERRGTMFGIRLLDVPAVVMYGCVLRTGCTEPGWYVSVSLAPEHYIWSQPFDSPHAAEVAATLAVTTLRSRARARIASNGNGPPCPKCGAANLLIRKRCRLCNADLVMHPDPNIDAEVRLDGWEGLRAERLNADTPAANALDEIAKLCGCPKWDYPGQLVRDVEAVVDERDRLRERIAKLEGMS